MGAPTLGDARPLPAGKVSGQRLFQFDLRDIFLAFLLTAGAMGTAGPFGIVLALYVLVLIVLYRVARATQHRSAYLGLTGLILLGFGFLFLCALPAVYTSGTVIRRTICAGNLNQIDLALHHHLSDRNSFPEAHVPDEKGSPMHSWRVAIVPYVDYRPLYEQYDHHEPWDGPGNSQLSSNMPDEFKCPSDPTGGPPITNYVAVTGPGTAWPDGRGAVQGDFRDGMSNTMLVTEVHRSGIHWMEPRDLTLDDLARGMQPKTGLGVSSDHIGGVNVAYADGSVRFISDQTSPELLRGLATVDGGEPADPEALEWTGPTVKRRPSGIAWFGSLVLMAISAGVLAFRPRPKNDPKAEEAPPV